MTQRISVWKTLASGGGMGLAVLVAVGIPSGVIPNPYFIRPLEARPSDYLFLGVITILAIALGATYGAPAVCSSRDAWSSQDSKALGGGLLLFIGIGCPVCNKVALALVGASGALTYFEPIQPLFSLASIVVMCVALTLRLRDVRRALGGGSGFGAAAPVRRPQTR